MVMMPRILVTGSSGFIGQALVKALASDGWSVRAASRRPTPADDALIEPCRLPDLTSDVDWTALIEEMDAVVHLAGIAHAGGPVAEEIYDRVNHRATADLSSAAARAGIKRLVFMSSIRAQAGPSSVAVLTEDDEAKPTDAYGRSKLAAERAVKDSGARYTILRPVIVHGPAMKGNLAALAHLATLPVPLPFGGFTAARSVVSLDSLVGAIRFVLTAPSTEGQTFIVADQPPLTLTDMLTLMREADGRAPKLFSIPKAPVERLLRSFGRGEVWDRIGGPLVADPARLIAAGWQPQGDSREMFKKSYATRARAPAASPKT
jgi:UDP-glucose 4-epimerase